MASILDQYEQESARAAFTGFSHMSIISDPIAGTGYVDARMSAETELPIFNKKKVNFTSSDPIIQLAISNNFLVIAMSSNILRRLDLEHPDQFDEVEITKAVDDRVHKIFQDPTGRHLIVSMASTENLYLSRNSKKPRTITKLKGHHIDSVGWNWQNASDSTTGAILLGTSKGLIFETELTANEDNRFFQSSLDQYLKQLFNVGSSRPVPVTGLEFDRMPTTTMTEYKYFILATTPGRLYQFLGSISTSAEPPMFAQIFQQYETTQEQFLEMPGNFGYSELKLYRPKFRECAKRFAWLTGPGVYYGDIDVTGSAGHDSVTANTKLMSYPRDDGEKATNPISLLLTEFHVLILFPERLKAVCILNEQLIYDDVYADRFGHLMGLCKDVLRGTIWSYTSSLIFRYKVIREARDVWQMYLDKGDFELAKEYSKDNPVHHDKVLSKQAEDYFKKGDYDRSALIFALTHNSFEEVTLKFINLQQKDALKIFLRKKLNALKSQDKTQMTMLVTWLIEIFLNQLGELKEQGQDMTEKYDNVQEDFRRFLAQARVKECVSNNRSTVYELIASHGDIENMVYFARLMEDFERVIGHHIQHDNYIGAMDILTRQNNIELYYKFSPLLMQYIPKETVNSWIDLGKKLDPKKLIPALVQCDHDKYREQGHEAIRYLEFCIQKSNNQDQAIHNYLLSLYAKLQPQQLMRYLHLQGQDADTICYDLKYALRLCAEQSLREACVHIYSVMGLYEEAVDLALSVDVELAKEQADKPDDNDEELRKKLWLRIARHVVEEEKDVRRAMAFLQECDLLKIEDILPFFPDFVTIDHFKDAIIQSLQEYNQHIDALKEEMDEATQSAEEIRKEIQSFRNKYVFVKNQDKCSSCGFPLLTRSFYLFPCQHKFHNDCLITEILPHMQPFARNRVEDLRRQLAELDDPRLSPRSSPSAGSLVSTEQKIKTSLDEIVATECVYCGDMMIRNIDDPFVDPEETDNVMRGWL